jgi:hypothetical protein
MCIVYHIKIMWQKCGNHIRTDMQTTKCNKARRREEIATFGIRDRSVSLGKGFVAFHGVVKASDIL